jgi:uncharacterized protein
VNLRAPGECHPVSRAGLVIRIVILGAVVYYAPGVWHRLLSRVGDPFGLLPKVVLPERLMLFASLALATIVFLTLGLEWSERRPRWSSGVTDTHWGRRFAIGAVFGGLTFFVTWGILALAGAATLRVVLDPPNALRYGFIWAIGLWVAAAGEEIGYRGYLILAIDRVFGRSAAILLTAIFFSLAHGLNPGANILFLVYLGLFGILLGWLVFRTGSIWTGMGFHFAWNWTQEYLFGALGSGFRFQGHLLELNLRGPAWLSGGDAGPEGSVPGVLALVLSAFVFAAFLRRRSEY